MAKAKSKFWAFGKYLVVEPFSVEEKTKGGIIVQAAVEEGKYQAGRGKVVSISANMEDVAEGDIIRFKKHHEHELEEGVWIISADDIIAIESK